MVQVDIFWSYGLGAGFALAAGHQLIKEEKEKKWSTYENKYFTHTMLFLSLFFAPSGICLLWAFTNWETMQVFNYDTLPAWLVTAFAITNITQGMLGFWVTRRLAIKGKMYLAFLQPWIAYFFMFFILVHGWDGTGYRRFFSYNREAFLNWKPSNVTDWLTCPVALTLYGMGVLMMPWLLGLTTRFIMEGYKVGDVDKEKAAKATPLSVNLYILLCIFGMSLGLAIGGSLLIHTLGWLLGTLVFMVLAFAIVLRKGGLFYRIATRLIIPVGRLT